MPKDRASTGSGMTAGAWKGHPQHPIEVDMGVSENRGTLFGGPYNKDPTI